MGKFRSYRSQQDDSMRRADIAGESMGVGWIAGCTLAPMIGYTMAAIEVGQKIPGWLSWLEPVAQYMMTLSAPWMAQLGPAADAAWAIAPALAVVVTPLAMLLTICSFTFGVMAIVGPDHISIKERLMAAAGLAPGVVMMMTTSGVIGKAAFLHTMSAGMAVVAPLVLASIFLWPLIRGGLEYALTPKRNSTAVSAPAHSAPII